MNANYVVLAQGNPFVKNAYLEKLALIMSEMNWKFEYWVSDRDGTVAASDTVKIIFGSSTGGWGGSALGSAGYYISWMLRVFVVAIRAPRDTTFLCSRFDTALPVALSSFFVRKRFVFLDRDTFSRSYAWPWPVKKTIEYAEGVISKRATLHILPGESRVQRPTSNMRIVRNTPHSALLAEARNSTKFNELINCGRIRVCISGLISEQRGSKWILDSVSQLKRTSIEFVMAGRLLGSSAEKLARLQAVKYLGVLSNGDALSLVSASDLVLAFYDPLLEINRLAEPNKWFDCVSLGVPFVSNLGLKTLEPFTGHEACIVLPYGDVNALVNLFQTLEHHPQTLKPFAERLRSMQFEPWDKAMKAVLQEICMNKTVEPSSSL